MARRAALLALVALAGCDNPFALVDLFQDDRTSLNVTNRGVQQVRVTLKATVGGGSRRSEDFLLDPGLTRTFTYHDVVRMEVHAWRTSDSVEIFSERWDSNDIKRHENVNLYP